MTVRGPVDPGVVGWTSMHDHVFWDSATWWAPDTFEAPELTTRPLEVRTSGLARWNALGIRDNLVMDPADYDAQRSEVAEFAAAGGTCLVDPTCEGLDPQPLLLRRMASELDLHIVAGAGIYVHDAHPPWVEDASVEDIEAFITTQVDVGLAGTDVRPGLIGEVGSSNPVTDRELRVLRAAARVGARTGTAVSVHMTAPGQHGGQVVDCLIAEGLDPSRIVLCHMDEVLDLPYHLSLLERGVTVEMDTFGFEGYFARLWKTPSDAEKMQFLVDLVDRGFAGQIVLGHDVALKCQLKRFGGLGYDHIPRRIVPTLVDHLGVTRDALENLLAGNPRRLLTRPGPGTPGGVLRGRS